MKWAGRVGGGTKLVGRTGKMRQVVREGGREEGLLEYFSSVLSNELGHSKENLCANGRIAPHWNS